MKIDRLIGILSVLLQKDMVTAPQLAEQFEVSRRTINRDIEVLCRAGIPICTRQGVNGGISIMDDYKIERALITSKEMQEILAGLRSLDSISGNNQYAQLMEKLKAGSSDFMSGNQSILIDLSSWYKASLAPKIEMVRAAIDNRYMLEFNYYSPTGESSRNIEPYYLIFKWSNWYVWGWCTLRKDFRMFKLNRMEQMKVLMENFGEREAPMPDISNERIFPGRIKFKALFEPEVKWRLVDEFGSGCFDEQPDGKLLFHADYTDKESLLTWILTFRDKVELLEPGEIRQELYQSLGNMREKYRRKI